MGAVEQPVPTRYAGVRHGPRENRSKQAHLAAPTHRREHPRIAAFVTCQDLIATFSRKQHFDVSARQSAKLQHCKTGGIANRLIQKMDNLSKAVREIIGMKLKLVKLRSKLPRRFRCANQFGILGAKTDREAFDRSALTRLRVSQNRAAIQPTAEQDPNGNVGSKMQSDALGQRPVEFSDCRIQCP